MPFPQPEEVAEVTQQILERPEFQARRPESILESPPDWLSELLKNTGGLTNIFLIILIVLVVAAIVFFIYSVMNNTTSRQTAKQNSDQKDALIALEGTANSWDEAITQAKAALAQGDAYRVIWITHRLFLGLLSSKERLKFERWKTNSDYLKEYEGKEEDFQLLQDLTTSYDNLVYAGNEMPLTQLEDLLHRVAEKRPMS